MDLLHLAKLNGFCIVSSDSDFTRLVSRLRESGMYVVGMGEQKALRSFVSACNKFSYLDLLYEESQKIKESNELKISVIEKITSAPVKQKNVKMKQQLYNKNIDIIKQSLKQITEENADSEGWVQLTMIGNLLKKRFPKFTVKKYGYKNLTRFLESLDMFETKQEGLISYYRLK